MGDYRCIQEVERTARKPHRCSWCGQAIAAGERYHYERCVFEGEAQSNHWHPECWTAGANECASNGNDWEYLPYENERPETTAEGTEK